jgi:hypothetical protein
VFIHRSVPHIIAIARPVVSRILSRMIIYLGSMLP